MKLWFKIQIFISLIIFSGIIGFFSISPDPFNDPYSNILLDARNELLGAVIAEDEQWRFPPLDNLPGKYKISLITFEDKYFYKHPGFNPFSLFRALWQNVRNWEIVSGGSTITMQVIRMSRKGKPRTIIEKCIEIVLALRLEFHYSKEEILRLYANHAPFGGNIVGLHAASWRYFGRAPESLSWAEATLLSILPNQPGSLFPGMRTKTLISKRNRLIDQLYFKNVIDSTTAHLAKLEPVPEQVIPLPQDSPHLMTTLINRDEINSIERVSIDRELQSSASEILKQHKRNYEAIHVHNASVLIAEINSGKVLVYLGNTTDPENKYNNAVDITRAPRSTGSVLKPILYAAMIQDGLLLPDMIIPDIPTHISGFAPQNYNKTYEGAVPASRAMARSLNVPAVRMLREYRYEKFHELLHYLGVTGLTQPASHYGLSLIIGGAEASLWDLTSMYASLSRILNHYSVYTEPSRYNLNDIRQLTISAEPDRDEAQMTDQPLISAGAIWHMVEAMAKVYRPEEDKSWQLYQSGRKIAWKTGTSYGNRDAWAIGFNPEYIVGVWVGNADGEGRSGLTGTDMASPLMFDLFNILPSKEWFNYPGSEMISIQVCKKSGFRASVNCETTERQHIYKAGIKARLCDFCRIIHVDKKENYRISTDCENKDQIRVKSWFVLPPVQEWYYKKNHSDYKMIPPVREDCRMALSAIKMMDMIYPEENTNLFIPRELSGQDGKAVLELAHRQPDTKVFWHLDSTYLGYTRYFHQMAIRPDRGEHRVVLVDEHGEKLEVKFNIISD